MKSNSTPFAPEVVNVLLVSPFDEDHLHLRAILRHSNLQQHSVRDRVGAIAFLRENTTPVVICESDLPDGTWRDVLAHFDAMALPPMLVVTSRFADEHLWSEALNLGAYNVLAKPLSTKEVFHVVDSAFAAWKQVRAHPRTLAQTA
jgi:DNA-binding NtrC family response regulator